MALDNGKVTLQTPIRVPFRGEKRDTTVGRLLFNETFPEDFAFQNQAMTKKRLQKVMAAVYQQYGQTKTAEIADDLKDLGFKHATDSGISIGMGDFKPVIGMDKRSEEHTSELQSLMRISY